MASIRKCGTKLRDGSKCGCFPQAIPRQLTGGLDIRLKRCFHHLALEVSKKGSTNIGAGFTLGYVEPPEQQDD